MVPDNRTRSLTELLRDQDGVLDVASARACLTRSALRWRIDSGRWRQLCHGVVLAQSGPLTDEQVLWAAVLWAGPGAALAGLTAARLGGFKGFDDQRERAIHVLVPASRTVRKERPRLPLVVHYSRVLQPEDIHPARLPPRTRMARSVVDAAAWMGTDRGAQAVLAAGVQQRLVRVEDLNTVVERCPRLHRRRLIRAALADIAGGAQALSELDFCRLVRRFGLPEPDRQAERCDSRGRRRWLDAVWEKAKLIVEIDGLWHMEAHAWWADMQRDNEFTASGYRVLRFPAFAVRDYPEEVARQIRAALCLAESAP